MHTNVQGVLHTRYIFAVKIWCALHAKSFTTKMNNNEQLVRCIHDIQNDNYYDDCMCIYMMKNGKCTYMFSKLLKKCFTVGEALLEG